MSGHSIYIGVGRLRIFGWGEGGKGFRILGGGGGQGGQTFRCL